MYFLVKLLENRRCQQVRLLPHSTRVLRAPQGLHGTESMRNQTSRGEQRDATQDRVRYDPSPAIFCVEAMVPDALVVLALQDRRPSELPPLLKKYWCCSDSLK